jgi:multiple sugar transport system substrate-binding protein
MISKRRVLAMKAGIAALMLAAASQASAQTTITFRFNDPEAPQMRLALDEFEKLNPDIKVTMQRVSWGDAQAQFLREAAVGQAPDVAQIAFVWPRAFGRAGALRPLDDLIAKTNVGVAGWEKFVSKDLATGADGKTYAIPFTTDTFAVMYNKDLVKAAGFDTFPTTWTGLKDLSKAVQARTGKTGRHLRNADHLVPDQFLYLVQGLGFR